MAQVSLIYDLVIVCVDRSRRSEERHGSALAVQDSVLADGLCCAVIGHDVTRGCDPQRQIGVCKLQEVGGVDNLLMRDLAFRAVSGIIHDERSLLLLLLYQSRHLRIRVARGCAHTLIGIPHNLLYSEAGMPLSHHLSRFVLVFHVEVVVAVVAHEHQCVLP